MTRKYLLEISVETVERATAALRGGGSFDRFHADFEQVFSRHLEDALPTGNCDRLTHRRPRLYPDWCPRFVRVPKNFRKETSDETSSRSRAFPDNSSDRISGGLPGSLPPSG